jgi:hypothetical protein
MMRTASSSASSAWRPERTGAAHRADRLPKRARAEAELEAPAREHVERGRLLGDHRRAAERQVGDVGEEADPLGAGEQVGDQRPSVEEAPLVWVVLDADQVEPELVRPAGERAAELEIGACRDDAHSEGKRPAVAGRHGDPSAAGGPADPAGYSSSGTVLSAQAASTGVTMRHAASASSPLIESAPLPFRTSSSTRP